MICQRGLKVCSNITLSKFAQGKKCISADPDLHSCSDPLGEGDTGHWGLSRGGRGLLRPHGGPPLLQEPGEALHVEVYPPVGGLDGAGGEGGDHLVHAHPGAPDDLLRQLLDQRVLLDISLLELLHLALEILDDEAWLPGGHNWAGLFWPLMLELINTST